MDLRRSLTRLAFGSLLVFALIAMGAGCSEESDAGATTPATAAAGRSVVVFTALDRVYSEPILKDFERQTGIRVDPVYDAEAAKTTGLINRLLARREIPECDVLWNNEVVQTAALAQQGVFTPYRSPNAARIPGKFRGPGDLWTGFAARARVLVYNTRKFPSGVSSPSLDLFTNPEQRGQGAIAMPYYGTTFTHVATLYERKGADHLRNWLQAAKQNGTAFAPGNGPVVELVASGERSFGLTDTDDARGAILDGKPIGVQIPDASDGALLIPNSVALVRGAPHPEEARRLIDFLLSADTERRLAEMRGAQIPLGSDLSHLETPWRDMLLAAPPGELPVESIAASRGRVIELLRELGMGQ